MDIAQRSNKRFVLAAAVLGLLAIFAIGARTVVADAFGGPLDAAGAIPTDMQAVLVVDLAEVRDFADSDLLQYAIELGQDVGELPPGDPEDAFIDFVDDELGIDIDRDVLSWIGRSAAVGFGGDLSEPEPESIIAAISVRDPEAAWRFIDLVVERTVAEVPATVTSETIIEGLRVVIVESAQDPAHLGIKGEYLVIADSRQSMEAAYRTIDSGNSVLDADWFEAANSELDRRAWMKIIIDPSFINEAIVEMSELLDLSGVGSTDLGDTRLTSIGFSYGLDGDQISMEAYVGFVEVPGFEASQPLPLAMIADLTHTPDLLFGVELSADFGERLIAGLEEAEPGALANMQQMSLDFLGIDFVSTGLAELGGHLIVSLAGSDLEFFDIFVAAGLADPEPLVGAFEELRSQLTADGIETAGRAGLIRIPDDSVDIGVLGDEFVFRLDGDPQSARPFAESEGYEWLEANFTRGVIFYMDIHSLMMADELGLDPEMLEDLEAMRLGATFDAGPDNVRFSAILEINLADR